jgi:hypothetical protein
MDAILIIVDRFLKLAKMVLTEMTTTTFDTTNVFKHVGETLWDA